MDIISFNEAATANGRIESFIENPDSTSGIVTVPKVIANGETITIPAGRVAVLPNVVVDGDLVVEAGGEIFVPAGANFSDLDQRIDALANTAVKLTGNETIAGTKTFTSSPIVPTPTTDTQAANKQYVDDNTLGNINNLPDKPTPINTDNLALQESGGLLKKLSWLNLKNTIFDGAISLTNNGYIKFPSIMRGLILQWGNSSGGVQSVTFPIAFSTTCLNVIATMHGSGSAQAINEQSTINYTTTGFRYTSYTWAKTWLAVGY